MPYSKLAQIKNVKYPIPNVIKIKDVANNYPYIRRSTYTVIS